MAMKFYDPGELNLLNGSSCSGIQCPWYCFPWDVMSANVIVLTGLTSLAADFVSDLGRDDPCLSCFCLFMTSAIVCLCLCPVSASHIPLILWCLCLSHCLSPWFSSFILTPHPALLQALPSSAEEPIEDRKACVSLAIHRRPSLSV